MSTPTLGQVATVLADLKQQGVTRGAIEYVLDKVYFEGEA
jgi:hypothetical protein